MEMAPFSGFGRMDSTLTSLAREHDRAWREAHYPTTDPHGPFLRPALTDTADDPNDPIAYYRLGARVMDSHQGLADRAFYWAIRLDPYFPQAYQARWTLLRQRLNWRLSPDSTIRWRDEAATRAADSLLYRAIAYDPFVNDPIDARRFAAFYGRLQRQPRDPLINGARAYAEGNYRKALDHWGQAIRRDRRLPFLHVARAHAWVRLRQLDSAITELSTLVSRLETIERDSLIAPYASKGHFDYAIGFLYARQDRFVEARAAYQRALEENLGSYIVHVRLAGIALSDQDTTAALNALETALLIEPEDLFVRTYYGALLAEAGHYADARRELETVVRADSDYALPYLYLGRVRDRTGDSSTARGWYARYLAHAARTAPDREWAEGRMRQ
jgi:Tfp pilus assembly protein PilF